MALICVICKNKKGIPEEGYECCRACLDGQKPRNEITNPSRNSPVYIAQWDFRQSLPYRNLPITEVRGLWLKMTGIPWMAPAQIENVERLGSNHKVLTSEQRQFGIDCRILSENNGDMEILSDFLPGQKSVLPCRIRVSSELEEDLTKNELVLEAKSRGGKCIIHGGSLGGFYATSVGKIYPLQTQQLHVPSKAALRDAGIPITKRGAYAGCHICNDAMSDRGGLLSVDEIRPLILQDIAARGITFREPYQVRVEMREVLKAFYVDLI